MSAQLLYAYFEDEEHVLAATRAARAQGLSIDDVYTPYAVHGMDEAMGLRQSRLTWVCFGAGLAGLVLAVLFEWWTSAVSWPLNIGGKPYASFPAFVPIGFELTVLSAALTTVAALFVRARIGPGKRARALPRVTNDRFALAVRGDDTKVRELAAAHGAVLVEVAP